MYSIIPSDLTKDILNIEISNDTIPSIFEFIDQKLGNNDLDGIIGGPPCQAYSTIGRANNESKKHADTRIYLYKHYLDFLNRYKPKFFVFENVKGLLSFKDISGDLLFPKIISEFKKNGYQIHYKIINASEYGVSQNRERLILVGFRNDLLLSECFFEFLKNYKEDAPNLKELFEDLPAVNQGGKSNKYKKKASSEFVRKYIRNEKDVLIQHVARPHNANDLKIYKLVLKAKNKGKNLTYTDIPAELQTHSNKHSFLDRYKALNKDSLSHTIVAHISKDGHYYIHPDLQQNRSITVREAARIQGFPDSFYFEKSRTAAFRQIGNAVPPILAYKIASAIVDFFKKSTIV